MANSGIQMLGNPNMKTKRITTPILAGILAFGLAACSKSEPNPSEDTKHIEDSPLTIEADALATKTFFGVWTPIEDSCYTKRTIEGGWPPEFIQIKGVSYHLRSGQISEADALNGLEWQGGVRFSCRVYRKFGGRDGPQWSEWREGVPQRGSVPLEIGMNYSLQKKNGHWKAWGELLYDVNRGQYSDLTKPTEEEIQAILPQ